MNDYGFTMTDWDDDLNMNGMDSFLEMDRFLHDLNATDAPIVDEGNSTEAPGNSTVTPMQKESLILRGTFSTYGSAFLVVFLLLSILRKRFPKAYNLREWVPDRKSTLADNQFGLFSWTWQMALIPDQRLLDECGMDATCFCRVCFLGVKLCSVGMLCGLFLMPVYFTAVRTEETSDAKYDDWVVKLTTANVGPGSPRLIATVVASYIIFGYTMFLIRSEMEHWFLTMRYKFLAKKKARNYAVYLRNIPPRYQTNHALVVFFEGSLGVELLEANIAMSTKNLQKAVADREGTIARLEHAVAEEEDSGIRPTHTTDSDNMIVPIPGFRGGESVDSIQFYAKQLQEQNKDIAERIHALRSSADRHLDISAIASDDGEDDTTNTEEVGLVGFIRRGTVNAVSHVSEQTTSIRAGATGLVAGAAGQAVNLIGGEEDGAISSAAFVTFKKLSTVHAAMQMVHYEQPYMMECLEAPEPDDIFWPNVGRQHKDLQLGALLSLAATTATCLFWTFPVSFVSSLSSVDALRKEIGFIDEMLIAAPFLEPLFAILAPQLLVILNAMLPVILTVFTQFEGPISGAMVEASLFAKLSAFMIIQTFFVSAISGGIFEELTRLMNDLKAIVDLLAKSLPAQSTFFMQLSVVMTVTTCVIEGLRVVPLALALVRRFVGPRLTEKERSTTFMGLRPLNEPSDFQHADFLSNMVLFFVIFLVYAVIAPLVSFILIMCFAAMGCLFRHQFVYIYNSKPDSGGNLFLNFIDILTSCLMIGEITVTGLLALKKSPVAVPLMLPLVIGTALFQFYIRKKHFTLAQHLPSRLCLKQDRKNTDMNYSFVTEEYLQPELREPRALPEISDDMIGDLGLMAPLEDEIEGGTIPGDAVSCRVTRLRLSESEFPDYQSVQNGKDSEGERRATDLGSLGEQSATAPESSEDLAGSTVE